MTRVVKDKVMAQVEVQAGPFRIVSLISRESADDLKLKSDDDVERIQSARWLLDERCNRALPLFLRPSRNRARLTADSYSTGFGAARTAHGAIPG